MEEGKETETQSQKGGSGLLQASWIGTRKMDGNGRTNLKRFVVKPSFTLNFCQAYRKVCLKMHPDKFATRGEEEIANAEEEFKKIQDAYEVLSNENSRRLYDSTDAFDDSIPIECDPADFFKVGFSNRED